MTDNTNKKLRIIHFNDVYNAWPKTRGDIVGGGARFVSLVNSYKKGGSRFNGVEPIVLFSGDVFFPSLASQVSLGKQMVPIMNALEIRASCLGNHDIDSGLDVFGRRVKSGNYPWLLSNVRLKSTGKLLGEDEAGMKDSHSFTTPDGSLKIGVIGLAEEQWVETLTVVDPKNVDFEDFVACAKRLSPKLRQEQGCDFVIALSHMRVPRDQRLAKEAGDEISLVLGGHDHDVYYETIDSNNVSIVKSGTDFNDLTVIDIELKKNEDENTKQQKPYVISSYKYEHVQAHKDLPEDPAIVEALKPFEGEMAANMKKIIGHNGVDLDCRFATIRTKESNVSNFVADCIRWNIHPKPDIVLINSGTLRTDGIVPAGPYTVADLMTMLPMLDFLAVIQITGAQVIEALENGVSQYPALEGRFPCVSGVRFKFDPRNPPGQRVIKNSIVIGSDALNPERTYTLCTKEYISEGHDGYNVFKNCPVLVEAEYLPSLAGCVSRYYLVQKAASLFASLGEKHSTTAENVKIAACKWFEKALKRSPRSFTPRNSGTPRATSVSMSDEMVQKNSRTTTPRPSDRAKPQFDDKEHLQALELDNKKNAAAVEPSSSTTTTDGMNVTTSSLDSPCALEEGESPTLHWAVKTFKMNPKVERRILNVAPVVEK